MPGPAFQERMVRRTPDPSSAIFALSAASESLASAKELHAKRQYNESFERCRDAIRLVSSALMFRDGCICDTLEASIRYLQERYPGMFPVGSWRRIESFQGNHGSGLLAIIFRMLGKVKYADREEADGALGAATAFVQSAREELVL